jgi:hypothetical protein
LLFAASLLLSPLIPGTIAIFTRPGNGTREEAYSTDRKETPNKMGNATAKSVLKWEGAAFLFDTLADGAAEQDRYTLMDRWRLVKDRERLLIHREIIRRRGEVEADLVYDTVYDKQWRLETRGDGN